MKGKSFGPECLPGRPDQIADAARTLFARYGYRRTSMDEIAREAGVAKATLYQHFKGKEDVFRSMMARTVQLIDLRCAEAEATAAAFRERLFALLDAHYGTICAKFGNPEHWAELHATIVSIDGEAAEAFEAAYEGRLAAFLTKADRAGEISLRRTGLASAALAEMLVQAARGAKSGPPPSLQEYRARLGRLASLFAAAVTP